MSINRYGVFGLLGATALILVTAMPAAAHVTVQPGEASKGSFAKFAFRVPNESDTAGTIKLQATFPLDTPIGSLRTRPMPGWTAEIKKETLPSPVKAGEAELTEAVRTITWTAQPGVRVGPGEFTEFEVSGGPLPDAEQLVIPTVQTYDDGKVVSWDAPPPAAGAEEPEHPAPVLKLVAAAGSHSDGDSHDAAPAASADASPAASDKTARWLGGLGLVVGALGLGVGIGALLATRRRPAGPA
jgi:periplasmic copper chaperone A